MSLNEPLPDPLLSIDDVAAYLGSARSTIYKWSRRGYPDYPRSARLPNGRIVTRRSDLEAWLEERAR